MKLAVAKLAVLVAVIAVTAGCLSVINTPSASASVWQARYAKCARDAVTIRSTSSNVTCIRAVQWALRYHHAFLGQQGRPNVRVDGVWGPITTRAVQIYGRENGRGSSFTGRVLDHALFRVMVKRCDQPGYQTCMQYFSGA
jgi:hypothetical protein